MNSQKFITSISTIPQDSKLYSHRYSFNYITSDIKLPVPTTLPLKFPKKNIRKQATMNMLSQTNQNPQKSCVRNYNFANKSIVFQEAPKSRRIANQGLFHSLSKESVPIMPLNRSLEDFGAPSNRKHFVEARHIRPDPIVVGHRDNHHNSAYQKVWTEYRRHRDNGKICEQTMQWKTKKTQGYLDRYKNKNKTKSTIAIQQMFSIGKKN